MLTVERTVNVLGADNKPLQLKVSGYDHFA
jgi:hypothetical protein